MAESKSTGKVKVEKPTPEQVEDGAATRAKMKALAADLRLLPPEQLWGSKAARVQTLMLHVRELLAGADGVEMDDVAKVVGDALDYFATISADKTTYVEWARHVSPLSDFEEIVQLVAYYGVQVGKGDPSSN